MKKKTKSKLRAADFLVILICLLIFSGFIFLFYKDLTHFTRRSDKVQVASVNWRERVVQRKFNDRVVWELLAPGAPLYEEDTIRTSDLSKTSIRFGSDDESVELDIYENTLVQIFTDEEGTLQINLSGGDIKVDSTAGAPHFSIKMADGSIVKVMGGSSVSAGSNLGLGRSTIDVASGQAELTASNGTEISLGTGESVSVDEDGVQRNPITVVSIPKNLDVISYDDTPDPVLLEWKTDASVEGSKITIQTSRTKDFSEIEDTFFVEDLNHFSLDPGDKTLYWRVYAGDDKENPAEGKISVNKIKPVQVVYPRQDAELEYRYKPQPLKLQWEGNEYAEKYTVTISKTPDMSNPILTTDVTSENFQSDSLPEGLYYWKVCPWYGGKANTEGESQVANFTVAQDLSEDVPRLSVPADNAKFEYGEKIPITFLWNSEMQNAESKLIVAKDPDFKNIVIEEKTDSQRLSTNFEGLNLPEGTYYWKVVRNDSDTSIASEKRSFQIVAPQKDEPKLLYPPDDFGVESEKLSSLNFMWKLPENLNGTSSILQVSPTKDFSSISFEKRLDGLSEKGLSLDEGTWWWRICTTEGGEINFTDPRKISVLGKLSAPTLENPKNSQEVLAYTSTPLKFQWEKVSGADYYSVKVYDSNGKEILSSRSESNMVSQADFTDGSYSWQVQAISSEKENTPLRKSAVSKGNFSVRSPERIQLISPTAGSSIAGLTALKNSTSFTWQKSADAVSYTMVLSKVNSDGSSRVVEQKNTAGNSVSISRLSSGTYTWKIKASTEEGLPLDSEERRLVVERVPELAKPVLTSPTSGFIIGPNYLRQHRSIAFTWNAVPGATSYSFNLYKKTADGKNQAVFSKRNVRGTKIELTDLSILDIGSFSWTVTAFAYASDGYEERRSQTGSSSFKIDFSLPEKVETITQGVIYVE